MYYLIGYRKKVVISNVNNSFPELSSSQRTAIVKEFYRHLCDLLVESLKIFTISKEEAMKRMQVEDVKQVREAFAKNKSVILAGGHLNNWELFAVVIAESIPHHTIGIYAQLKNKFFDEKTRASREKYGLEMVPTKAITSHLEKVKGKLTATIFAIDQSPSNPHKSIWLDFLNQDTSVFYGAEKFAKKYDYPVFYGSIKKLKRGYYSFKLVEVCADPLNAPHGEITEIVTKRLEYDIREQPAYWLWSHKRWKRSRPADYKFNLNEA